MLQARATIVTSLFLLVMTIAATAKAQTRFTAGCHYNASTRAICAVWGPYRWQALRVSGCESGYRTWAKNGQYLGLFQMGKNERATYGHGPGAWAQAKAALRYFIASGRDWSPWECKP